MSDGHIEGINLSLNIAYSPEQFIRLAEAIAEEGGEQLDELCSARQYQFSGPNPDNKSLFMPGCGNYSIFEIPYEMEPIEGTNAAVLNTIRVCAVCDALGWKPRYWKTMRGRL